jgi:hypothetical protein
VVYPFKIATILKLKKAFGTRLVKASKRLSPFLFQQLRLVVNYFLVVFQSKIATTPEYKTSSEILDMPSKLQVKTLLKVEKLPLHMLSSMVFQLLKLELHYS